MTAWLPDGYDEQDARRDRRDLATLRSRDVNWRVRRRLRHRVGGEEVLLERLAAWDEQQRRRPSPHAAVEAGVEDAVALAAAYREVCDELYGPQDAQVAANAAAIARGAVPPWEARRILDAERRRLDRQRGMPTGPTTGE